jgi:hypothetical protein
MDQLFQRRCTLILAPPISGSLAAPAPSQGIQIQDFRVQFKVAKTSTKEPNTADIQVFNLAQSTRAKLQSRGTRVILLAGYDKDAPNLPQVFTGDSRSIDHVRDGADWCTKIQCGDGERNYKFALVNESFKPGANIVEALKKCITAMALDPGNSAQALASITQQYVSGYAMQGKASAELDSQLAGLGLEWSIQDGKVVILPHNGNTNDSAVVVTVQTGLLNEPEHGAPEVIGAPPLLKFRTLLNPLIRPWRKVFVQYRDAPAGGYFTAVKVDHSGDTHKGEWYTDVQARAAS